MRINALAAVIALGADVWLSQTFDNPQTTPYQINLAQFDKYFPGGMRPEDMNATAARILNADGRLVLTNDGKAAQLTAPAAAIPNGVFAANADGKLSIISVPVTVLETLAREELDRLARVTGEGFDGASSGALFGIPQGGELEEMRGRTQDGLTVP